MDWHTIGAQFMTLVFFSKSDACMYKPLPSGSYKNLYTSLMVKYSAFPPPPLPFCFYSVFTVLVELLTESYNYSMLQPVFTEWGDYSTYMFTDKAIDIINTHDKTKPLFLYLPYQAVHRANYIQPIQAPPELVNKFKNIDNLDRRTFAAVVSALDSSVGKVRINLADILDVTSFVFFLSSI